MENDNTQDNFPFSLFWTKSRRQLFTHVAALLGISLAIVSHLLYPMNNGLTIFPT